MLTERDLKGVLINYKNGERELSEVMAAVEEYSESLNAAKPVVGRSSRISKAKLIVSKIYELTPNSGNDWNLNKATDAIYAYIKNLENG